MGNGSDRPWLLDRRQFLRLAGLGGVAFSSALTGRASSAASSQTEFYFVQLSDTHWGFNGPAVNPEAANTLPKAVAAVNALGAQPDFVVFTGDLTHTTDDAAERRRRLAQFKEIAGGLKVKKCASWPASTTRRSTAAKRSREFFGATHYTFDHKGVHFIVLDNVSRPGRAHRRGTARLAEGRPGEAGPRKRRSSS